MSLSAGILSYINALKWPIVVTGGIVYFRKPFVHILDRVSKSPKGTITGPAGTGITWDDTLREADAAIGEAKAELPEKVPSESEPGFQPDAYRETLKRWAEEPYPPQWSSTDALLGVSPPAAVVMAFAEVEQAVRALAEPLVERSGRMGVLQLARAAQLPDDILQALSQLAELRNAVIHQNAQPDIAMASDFVRSARDLYNYLAVYRDLFGGPPPADTSE